MLKLRKILLCDFIYYGILFLSIIVLVIRLSLPKESTYSEKSKTFIGTVEDIRIKEKKLTLTIKNTERVIATYYLKENGDTDSCTFSIDRNTYIGISLPEDFENITYDIYYKDIPFFDIVDITLKEKSENTVETIEVGESF